MSARCDDYSGRGWRKFWYKNLLGLVPYRFKTPLNHYVIPCKRRYEIRLCKEIFGGMLYPFGLLASPIRTVLDAGANIGTFAFYCADQFPTVQKIIAIEPFSTNAARISDTAATNRLHTKILVVNAAVSDQKGRGELRLGAAHYSHSLSSSKVLQPKGTQSVEITTIDDVRRAFGVDCFDLVKIDVEGLELNAIRGAAEVLAHAQYVIVEAHRGFCSLADLRRELHPFALRHAWPENAEDSAFGDFMFVRTRESVSPIER